MWLDELAENALDPSSRVPLHRQLSTALRARVIDGSLPAGSQFPTEAELQERFGISRSVVRQALLALSAEGLLQRGRGRGSVVAPRGELHRLVQRSAGLSTQLANVTTEVLALEREHEPQAEAALGVRDVLGIRRLRSADGEPIALIHTWLPFQATSTLTAGELTDASLHAILRRRFGLAIVAGRRQVRAVAASASLATSLRVAVGAPLLLLEGTSVDASAVPVEMFRTWHRADRVVFDIDVLEGSDTGAADLDAGAVAGTSAAVGASETVDGTVDGDIDGGDQRPRATELAGRARKLAQDLEVLARDVERCAGDAGSQPGVA